MARLSRDAIWNRQERLNLLYGRLALMAIGLAPQLCSFARRANVRAVK